VGGISKKKQKKEEEERRGEVQDMERVRRV